MSILSEREDQMFDRFSHPMMYVNDLDRAVKFYTETLGFTANFVVPNAFASLRHDGMGCRIDLHPAGADSKDVGSGPILYFAAKDFDGAITGLKQRGIKVGEARREGNSPRFVIFWDSEGNVLGIEEALGI